MKITDVDVRRSAEAERATTQSALTPYELCCRVSRRLLESGLIKNPLGLTRERYPDLLPSWAQKQLSEMCGKGGVPREIERVREILIDRYEIDLSIYGIAGRFVSTHEMFKQRTQTVRQDIRTWCNLSASQSLRYIVCGDPGSGKSFYIRELGHELITEDDFIEESASDYQQPMALIIRLLERIDERLSVGSSRLVVYVDEVDTSFKDGYLYEHLYHLMVGSRPADTPEGPDIHSICWFFAASCALSTDEFISYARKLPVTTKIQDFISRIPPPNRIDLPKLDISPMEQIVRGVALLKKQLSHLTSVEGEVLCLLGSRTFESTRELSLMVEESCRTLPPFTELFTWDALRIPREEKIEFVADYHRFLEPVSARSYIVK